MTNNKSAQCLTAEQARTFIKAVKGHDLEALFTVALATGMRKGELLALDSSDINEGVS
jgi:integrase